MSTERRVKARYPLELAVQYQTMGPQKSLSGAGRTMNVSSSGALIAAEHKQHNLYEGARLKITMEWPTLLNGTTPLQLVTTAKVVRRQESTLGVEFDWYQFRTMKRGSSTGLRAALAAAMGSSSGAVAPTAMATRHSLKPLPAAIQLRNAG